ncbi:MAG: hypothetical protein MAG795_01246 [Candidatus Woesearchaeota archaeon]|nr:hypothetical protein [Candidatus Woesearchaeota archaeon]
MEKEANLIKKLRIFIRFLTAEKYYLDSEFRISAFLD